jgi:hypothetical protein
MHSIVRTISLPQLSPALLLLSLIASFVTSGCADATPPPT